MSQARLTAKMSQDNLAKAIGEKSSVIVDIENASGPYKAAIINQIEKVLNCQIPRGRKKNKKKKWATWETCQWVHNKPITIDLILILQYIKRWSASYDFK